MNKFYIKFFFFLLIISLFVNNKTLATESAPKKDTKSKSKKDTKSKSKKYIKFKFKKNTKPKSKKCYPTPEEIYEKNEHLLCTNHEEIKNAEKLMNETVTHLEHHAISKDGYKLYDNYFSYQMVFYKKKHLNHTYIEKTEYIINNPNKYNKIINNLWDPDCDNFLYEGSVKRKIVRVYNPNLVMIQQRSKSHRLGRQEYFYALAAKFEISENITMIAYVTPNINDHNPSNKEYKNEIVPNANLFKTDIDSEEDIRKGKLIKQFVNIAGYIIEKSKWRINIIYVQSIERHVPNFLKCMIRKALNYSPPQK